MTTRTKVATLDELRDFARAFSDWFRDLDAELLRSPLQAKERDEVDAILYAIADLTEDVTRVLKRSQKWEAEK